MKSQPKSASRASSPWNASCREWLGEPEICLNVGRYEHGALMELVPRQPASLSTGRYTGRFAGLRDLHLAGELHHAHLDLGCFDEAHYVVSPSVCFAFRPSFEVRLRSSAREDLSDYGVAVSLYAPYRGAEVNTGRLERYFGFLVSHLRRFPLVTRFSLAQPDEGPGAPDDLARQSAWRAVCETVHHAVAAVRPLPIPPPQSASAAAALLQDLR